MRNITLSAVQHQPWLEYRHTQPDGRVCIRIRTAVGEWDQVQLCHKRMYSPTHGITSCEGGITMRPMWQDELHQWYEVAFMPEDRRLHYLFLFCSDGCELYLDQDGWHTPAQMADRFPVWFPYAHAWTPDQKPDWARGVAGYQIFPDRFRRSGPAQADVEPWGSKRVENKYRFGGNLAGMFEAVPYLKDLGVGLVYMTPLFVSDTSHRYNTFDYFTIDPLMGTTQDLKRLTDALHQAGIRIVLDGVFNHCGTKFAPFADAKAKGAASTYANWFFFDPRYDCGYATFGNEAYMPKLNLADPQAAEYFLEVGRYWLRTCGVDGWRLDVSPEVWPDFWRQFRKAVLAENPEAILVAECWDDSREWLSVGDMFDSTMHYVLSRAIWGFFAEDTLDLRTFDARVNRTMALYPHATQEVLWNFLGTHDTKRFLTRAGGELRRLRQAALFQMTAPGAPIVYYGDELGMEGENDPFCRGSMCWEQIEGNPVRAWFKKLIALRNGSPALRYGTYRTWHVGSNGVYAYLREDTGQNALVILNTADVAVEAMLPLPVGLANQAYATDALSGVAHATQGGAVLLRLPPREGAVFFY
ncbi:MAG: glycoside hydrolase family 13 protein [Clostridia bacterium]|nr:glycoside hydrolase family 13 protein [Clostridia bacterium]